MNEQRLSEVPISLPSIGAIARASFVTPAIETSTRAQQKQKSLKVNNIGSRPSIVTPGCPLGDSVVMDLDLPKVCLVPSQLEVVVGVAPLVNITRPELTQGAADVTRLVAKEVALPVIDVLVAHRTSNVPGVTWSVTELVDEVTIMLEAVTEARSS
ncbi:hypothetical protein ACLOJK_007775 [Asimina triloba]